MKNFTKIAQGLQVSDLLLQIQQNEWLWNRDGERLYENSPHHDSDDIWIRANDRTEFDRHGNWKAFNDEHESVWYDAYYALPAVKKLVFDLARHVEAERIGDILMWRVRPGQKIHPHRDSSWHVGFYDKFNICIQSAPGCSFIYMDHNERIEDRPGDVHRFTNTELHEVVNTSDTDYIVMVVCLRTHDYRRSYKRES